MVGYDYAKRIMIYAAALNFAATYTALESSFLAEPYKAPPKAPVLYIKPPHCRAGNGVGIACPAGVPCLQAGGTLAVEMGRAARRVPVAQALGYVAGYRVANDISIPEASYFRPAIAQQCRDGFCPVSEVLTAAPGSLAPDALTIQIFVNDVEACRVSTSTLVRSVAQLIADVTEFMTLDPGDLLLVGVPPNPPLVSVGDRVRVDIEGIGTLANQVVPEPSA